MRTPDIVRGSFMKSPRPCSVYTIYMKTTVLLLGSVALVLLAGFYSFNAYIYSEKQAEAPIERYRGTLAGEFVCLPHVDTTGPQTDECAFGIRTEAGEYYAVDFALMSQESPQLAPGERFSASGMITPIEMLSSDHWRKYPVVGIFSVTDSVEREAYACDADAKMCPDGTAVGRSGPKCEFAPCPSPERASATLTTHIGGSPAALTVTVNPRAVVSDSRCPQGVQCVWAGTVEVRTVLSTPVSHGEHVMKLGEPQRFGDFDVTLTEVTPQPKADEAIPESSYRFTYRIERR